MTTRGLNDTEVANEMNKMVSFIKQEALEKAREIKIKADEEFNIEKAKLVRQETVSIEAFYQKKMKQAEIQKKMWVSLSAFAVYSTALLGDLLLYSEASNQLNKARLRVLQARQQVLSDLMQTARGRLGTLSQDPTKYQTLLKDLILQVRINDY